MTDPQKDEHIEELLSKLQGIFGKLSHTDEESEPAKTIEVSAPAPKERELQEQDPTPPPVEESQKVESPAPLNFYESAASNTAPNETSPSEQTSADPAATESAAASVGSLYETTVPTQDPDKVIVSAAVYYSPGKEAEAKSLSMKLETMTPKFTKVAFRLRIGVCLPYDPKSNWKESILAKASEVKFQAVFVIIDRPLDDARRKVIAAELEEKNVYFHEVLAPSIEKKAFYTDILLGLVFFFDSRKPGPAAE